MGGVSGLRCVVTGGSGFVGCRLVEMLVERGAASVVSFDIAPGPPELSAPQPGVEYVQGDLSDAATVERICEGADCVWHIAALVGPYHPRAAYHKVNYEGTLNVIAACRKHKVPRIVMSSSPSTRFDGKDIAGLAESELKIQEPGKFLQPYAETKAMGEVALREACCDELMTVAIAPHQVYGPRDALMLPNLLHAAKTGKLRVFGAGDNDVAFTHVDNYCHALILGYDALHKGSPALGKFYVATDGGSQKFWRVLDQAVVAMDYPSLFSKMHLPVGLLMVAAYLCNLIGFVMRRKLKLTPFTVKMLVIDRWFNIDAARTELGYEPLISFEKGWKDTVDWFVANKEWWIAKAAPKPGPASAKKHS
mmetsp:Transcript_35085/g.88420  ORF Transcript_35085/g.88420 Transcript_35085/m.88420 type:complete len:364 (+) Transcript_35085:80-1171(+)|eukprot:jgi/Tetstr1/444678/TSEL_032526.t1